MGLSDQGDEISEKEFATMLRERLYSDTPRTNGERRTPITEEFLVNQDARRRAAVRGFEISQSKRMWGALKLGLVWTAVIGGSAALFAGIFYALSWLWSLL